MFQADGTVLWRRYPCFCTACLANQWYSCHHKDIVGSVKLINLCILEYSLEQLFCRFISPVPKQCDNTIWCWCSSPCTIPQSVGQCDHNDSWFVGDDDSDCVGDGENFTQRLYLFKKNFFLLLERSGGLYKFWLEWLNDDDNDGDFAAAGCTAPPWRFLKCCQFLPNL